MTVVRIGERLSIEDLVAVARDGATVVLTPEAVVRIARGRAVVDAHLADTLPHYGINTGFGALAEVPVSRLELAALQLNLIRSHAAGVGTPLQDDDVRAAMLDTRRAWIERWIT